MKNVTEIFTTYKVLEIREPLCGDKFAPIVIIAEKSDTKERRRIEIHRNAPVLVQIAKMLVVGDVIGLLEWKSDGKRNLREIVTYFKEEEICEDEF